MDLKKKYGPLPLWAWGLSGVVAIYLYYRYSHNSSSSSASSVASNTGIDPVTGVPYVDEQAAYQNEAASAMTPTAGGGSYSADGTTGTSTGPDLGQEIQDVTGLITSLEGSGLIPSAPAANSDGTTAAPTNQSAPTTAPSTNNRMSTGTLLHAGAIQAPFGSTAPPSRAGYTAVGTGNGNWQYVPNSLVNVAGGYLFGSISHNAPHAPSGYTTHGLGNGLWEIIPGHRNTSRTRTRAGAH